MAEPSASRVKQSGARRASKTTPFWRRPEPKPAYGVVVIGGGAHALATAYYLAREHDQSNVAVLADGWLGDDGSAHETAIVRLQHMMPAHIALYAQATKLWENLSHELAFNVMYSQRGAIDLISSQQHETVLARRGNAMALRGLPARFMEPDALKTALPAIDISDRASTPVLGALEQKKAGLADRAATTWGYARAADRRGVDIIEDCRVSGFILDGARVTGVRTSRGDIFGRKIAVAVAGGATPMLHEAGVSHLPLETHLMQSFASEPIKPLIDPVIGIEPGARYLAQARRGEIVFGGPSDGFNSHAERGRMSVLEDTANAILAHFPSLARLRLQAKGAETVDMTMDGSPIITAGPRPGLYLNVGWGRLGAGWAPVSGWCFAHTIAQDRPHTLNAPFSLDRFQRGLAQHQTREGPAPWLA